jgi:hypothetical protein
MHYVIENDNNNYCFGLFNSLKRALEIVESRFTGDGAIFSTYDLDDRVVLFGRNDKNGFPYYVKLYDTLPAYRVSYVTEQGETFTLHNDLQSVVRAIIRYALEIDYPIRLEYLLHYVCFEVLEDSKYQCSCFRHTELRNVWHDMLTD